MPTGFWDQLQALGKGRGQRLVLPATAADYLPSMLAMENPGFFHEYEVLLAENFQQLLDLTAKTPDEPLAESTVKFREFRERVGTQDVRQHLGNRLVRQRLGEIVQATPFHYSARMLLLQASGTRPTVVTRPVLASELRRAIEPMDWIVKKAVNLYSPVTVKYPKKQTDYVEGCEIRQADITKMNQTIDHCRLRVEGLLRYADRNDRNLWDRTRKAVVSFRRIEKASKTRAFPYLVADAIRISYGEIIELQNELNVTYANEIGEPPPTPIPMGLPPTVPGKK